MPLIGSFSAFPTPMMLDSADPIPAASRSNAAAVARRIPSAPSEPCLKASGKLASLVCTARMSSSSLAIEPDSSSANCDAELNAACPVGPRFAIWLFSTFMPRSASCAPVKAFDMTEPS